MRFGVCVGAGDLAALSQLDYDYVELGIAGTLQPEEPVEAVMPPLSAKFARLPIKAETYNLLLPGDLKVVGPDADPVRQARYLEAAFARARLLGGEIAVFGSGGARRIPDGWPHEEATTQVSAFLQRCGDAAAKHGMTVVIEPLNVSECNFINSVTEAVTLAQEVNHPSVGVLSDLYHVAHDGQSYAETRAASTWLHHVHVAGVGRRAPQAGDIDFLRGYFAVLKAMDYQGRISIEANWENLVQQAPEALAVLKGAWESAEAVP